MPRRNPFAPPRRRQRGWGGGYVKNPPKAINIQAPKLDLAGLTTAYEWMVVNKIVGFKLAFEWYANNVTALLYGDPLDADRQKTYGRALKSKELGDSSTIEPEKLHAWTTAIHLYEKIWANKNLPKVDDALASTATTSKRIEGVQTVLRSLNGAYETSGVKFRMTFSAEREFSDGEILLPQTELDQMIAKPPLSIVMGEIITVAKVISLVTQEDGSVLLDSSLFMTNLPLIHTRIAEWAMSADKINKPIGKAPKITSQRVRGTTPRPPRTPQPPRTPGSLKFGFTLNNTIHIVGVNIFNGKRAEIFSVLKDGMSVSDYIAAAKTKGCGQGPAVDLLYIMQQRSVVTVQ